MAKRSILGTPLGSLLSSAIIEEPVPTAHADLTSMAITSLSAEKSGLMQIAVEKLVRSPYQPRRVFQEAALQELADSIRSQGIIQPIVARALPDKTYEIIAGERRWRAAQLAGLNEVPVIVRDVDDATATAMAIIENLQREDLNPIEEAVGLERLMTQFGLTHQAVGELVGKSRAMVSNLLRLLTLRDEVKMMVEQGELEMGHARALLALSSIRQLEVARLIIAKHWSVRQTELCVRNLLNAGEMPKEAPVRTQDPDVAALEQRLGEVLGAKLQIDHLPNGRGKLVISYHSLEELDGIIAHIS
ncbi:MAG: ParB/RepB/Spo0J family partition protein [Gammaproteobacteria bacterium]